MSAEDVVRGMLMQAEKLGGKLEKLDVGAKMYAELGGKDGEQLVVQGVPVNKLSPRDEILGEAMQYAYLRWGVNMSLTDVQSLMKAVETDELMSLVPLIIDQHLDDMGYEDPVSEMDDRDVENLLARLKEHGFEGVEL